ncbi:MAG: alpha/beta hydrolase [Myxococcota bacterium]
MSTVSDSVLGAGRLVFDGVGGLTTVVERMHETIARHPLPFSRPPEQATRGHGLIAAGVYESIRTVNGWARDGFALGVGPLLRRLDDPSEPPSARREALVSVLNGVYGDHLDATGNPLAIPMSFRADGRSVQPQPQRLATALPNATPHVLILIHGLCLSDRWQAEDGQGLGSRLREEADFTPLTLRYNTGRHISTNGRELAGKLEALLAHWPVEVESLTLIGHSMGGLVARSAGGYGSEAGHAWPGKLRSLVCLGSPHHGAPLEKSGNVLAAALRLSQYTDPLGLLGRIRSAGIKDLRYGNLCDEDWHGRDPDALAGDSRRPLPLLPGVKTCFAAATLAREDSNPRLDLIGDGLVRTPSALGQHADERRRLRVPPEHRHVFHGLGHLELIGSPIVHQKLVEWLS